MRFIKSFKIFEDDPFKVKNVTKEDVIDCIKRGGKVYAKIIDNLPDNDPEEPLIPRSIDNDGLVTIEYRGKEYEVKLKNIDKVEIFSVNESESKLDPDTFDWTQRYEISMPILKKEFLDIIKNIPIRNCSEYNLINAHGQNIEWYGKGRDAKLILKKDIFYKRWLDILRTEEICEDLKNVITDIKDNSNVDVDFECIKLLGMQDGNGKNENRGAGFMISWNIGNFADTIDTLNLIKDALSRIDLDYKSDLEYEIAVKNNDSKYHSMRIKFYID